MENKKKVYDMNRINTLLHYEKIPAFTMTKEQKAYLEGYRAQLAESKPVEVEKIETVTVEAPKIGGIAGLPDKEADAKIDAILADVKKELAEQAKEIKAKKQNIKKTKKTTTRKTTKKTKKTEE